MSCPDPIVLTDDRSLLERCEKEVIAAMMHFKKATRQKTKDSMTTIQLGEF